MGVIEIENMEFYAFHGCYKEEQIVGNKFLVSACIKTDCKKAAETDQIEDALSYLEAYQIIEQEMKKTSHLLEHVCSRILDVLYLRFPQIAEATIKVSKMNPPLGGSIEKVSVSLTR